jgi:NAD(P)-dependent dehydrogenase (short-subunit alcohol dehydrogenase family)
VVAGDRAPEVPEGAIGVQVDVSSPAGVEGLVAVALEQTGRLDVMCNIAGIGSTTSALDCTPEEWDSVFAVNARGVFLGTKFTRQVAVQYAGQGVRCVSICPGTVDSPWVGRLLDEAPDPDTRRKELVARQPLGRLGEPVEIARAVLYAASDDAAFMTGSELVIDGGITAA